MNTKPDNIPALPEGAVYLGKGGCKFKSVPFDGWMHVEGDPVWHKHCSLHGGSPYDHYAAPADSEVARLNGFEVPTAEKRFCKCTSIKQSVLGDGCDECNPEMAKEVELDNLRDEIVDLKAQLSEAVRLGDLLIPYTTEAEERENIAAWEAFKASSVKGGVA